MKYLNDTQTARLWAKIKAGFVKKSGDTMTGALTLAGDPVSDLQAATKKYVDDNAGGLPSQTGQSGKFLTTDGTDASWEDVDSLPSQTGQSGKFLTTDGTDASWEDVYPLPDQYGQRGKFLTTDGRDAYWRTVDALPSQSGKNGKYLKTNGTAASWEDVPDNSFYAEYGVATLAQVEAAYDAGKYVYTTYQIDENITLHAPLVLVYPSTGVSFAAYDGENLEILGLGLYGWERYLTKPLDSAGGTMTGDLTLSGAPTSDLHAATKKYVDDYVGDIETLLASI